MRFNDGQLETQVSMVKKELRTPTSPQQGGRISGASPPPCMLSLTTSRPWYPVSSNVESREQYPWLSLICPAPGSGRFTE